MMVGLRGREAFAMGRGIGRALAPLGTSPTEIRMESPFLDGV